MTLVTDLFVQQIRQWHINLRHEILTFEFYPGFNNSAEALLFNDDNLGKYKKIRSISNLVLHQTALSEKEVGGREEAKREASSILVVSLISICPRSCSSKLWYRQKKQVIFFVIIKLRRKGLFVKASLSSWTQTM